MKKTKRLILTTLTAITVVTTAAFTANAAQPKAATVSWKEFFDHGITCVQQQKENCSWFVKFLQAVGLLPQNKPEIPDADIPEIEIPEETPDAEVPEETPDVEIPEESPVLPEEKPEVETPILPEEKPEVKPEEKPEVNEPSSSVHAYEKAVVELVNQERAKYNLAPLTLSADLCAKARVKSQDMATNNYFSHNSPTYGTPFEMMKQFGITYRSAGENIAMGYATPQAVVNAWMNSEGHRKNILSANFTTLGVGYVANGNYWTQWFIG